MSAPPIPSIVFAPDLPGASLFDPHALHVVEQWRDGAIKVVINRPLLMLQLKALRDMGLTPELVRRWTLWLTSPGRADYLDDPAVEARSTPVDLCESLAAASGAIQIVCWRLPNGSSRLWLSSADFARGQHG